MHILIFRSRWRPPGQRHTLKNGTWWQCNNLLTTCVGLSKWEALDGHMHGASFLISAWISNHMSSKMWDGITYPFPNFKEVWEWISNPIPHFILHSKLQFRDYKNMDIGLGDLIVSFHCDITAGIVSINCGDALDKISWNIRGIETRVYWICVHCKYDFKIWIYLRVKNEFPPNLLTLIYLEASLRFIMSSKATVDNRWEQGDFASSSKWRELKAKNASNPGFSQILIQTQFYIVASHR